MRVVIEITGAHRIRSDTTCRRKRASEISALRFVRLVKMHDALENIARIFKRIAHVVEEHERDTVAHQRQRWRRQAQLKRIRHRTRSTNREARRKISRASTFDAEAA